MPFHRRYECTDPSYRAVAQAAVARVFSSGGPTKHLISGESAEMAGITVAHETVLTASEAHYNYFQNLAIQASCYSLLINRRQGQKKPTLQTALPL